MKLWMKLAVLLLVGALAPSAFAQTPLVRIVADHLAWLYSTEVTATVKCPTGYFPITYAETSQFSFDFNTVYQRDLVNSTGGIVPRTTLSSATSLMGGGVTIDIYNEEHHTHNSDAKLICLSAAASSDGTFTLVQVIAQHQQAIGRNGHQFLPRRFPRGARRLQQWRRTFS